MFAEQLVCEVVEDETGRLRKSKRKRNGLLRADGTDVE